MSRAVMDPSLMSLPVTNFAAVALLPPTTVATTAAARIDLFMRALPGYRCERPPVAWERSRDTTLRERSAAVDRTCVRNRLLCLICGRNLSGAGLDRVRTSIRSNLG